MELEVPWNPLQVFCDLQKACQILSERGLKLSAKWAAEQLVGLPPVDTTAMNASSSTISDEFVFRETDPAVVYAKTLLELGEYAHAASVLSEPPLLQPSATGAGGGGAATAMEMASGSMPPPLANLSPYAFYLRAYALYMDGERRKEEKCLELSAAQQKTNAPAGAGAAAGAHAAATPPHHCHPHSNNNSSWQQQRNPYLPQLLRELQAAYAANELDAFGLHVYGMVLKEAHGRKTTGVGRAGATTTSSSSSTTRTSACSVVVPPNAPTPQAVLMQSVLQFPYNWSAWLDLAAVALEERDVEREIEETVGTALAENFMFHFFCAHLQAENQVFQTALQIYERWLDPALLGASPYLATQAAVVQYNSRQFTTAKRLLQDLQSRMPYRLDSMDIYSNILYVQEDAVGLGQLAHAAVQVDKYRAETCCIIGNYYSLKQQRAKAIQYFSRALLLDRTFTSAWTLMGHEYVEWKQTANACTAYRQAVQVNPADYRAWYGLGQTYELLGMNLYALYYYKQAAALRPFDARMWTAVGNSYALLKRTQHAIRAYERALQQDDTEGVATQKLASLYRQEGSDEQAAQCYMQHLQNRYNVTHPAGAAAGEQQGSSAAGAVVNLDVMLQGLHVEAPEAEALLYLANYYRDNAEYDMAATLSGRLLEYPGPEKEVAKALLREIRSRKAMAGRRVIHTRSRGPVPETFEFSP